MAGLDPVIHLLRKILGRLMDPRIKGVQTGDIADICSET